MIKLSFVETRIKEEQFYSAKKPINVCYLKTNNIVISIFVKTNSHSKYLIKYLGKNARTLILILPKITGYVKNSLANEKLLQKCKTISTLRLSK